MDSMFLPTPTPTNYNRRISKYVLRIFTVLFAFSIILFSLVFYYNPSCLTFSIIYNLLLLYILYLSVVLFNVIHTPHALFHCFLTSCFIWSVYFLLYMTCTMTLCMLRVLFVSSIVVTYLSILVLLVQLFLQSN